MDTVTDTYVRTYTPYKQMRIDAYAHEHRQIYACTDMTRNANVEKRIERYLKKRLPRRIDFRASSVIKSHEESVKL